MSQLEVNRVRTIENLDAYNKVLELTTYSMEAGKPKIRTDSNGIRHEDNHHVPSRYSKLADQMLGWIIDMGGKVIIANEIYVGRNLDKFERAERLKRRIEIQNEIIAESGYVEHVVRTLNRHKPFATSTFTYWTSLIVNARIAIVAWRDSDKMELKGCELLN